MSAAYLYVSYFFGLIASVLAIYGWRRKNYFHFFSGIAVMGGLYVSDDPLYTALISLGLLAAWFALKGRFSD